MPRMFGRTIISFVLLAFALIEPTFAQEQELSLYEQAKLLDPLGDNRLRPDIPGAWKSEFGIQFHPYCIKMLRKVGHSESEIHKGLEKWIEVTIRAVTDRCLRR